MAVLAGNARSGTVEAIGPCQLLRFDGGEFLSLLESYPEIGRGLIKSLVDRLSRAGSAKGQRPATMIGLLDK
jgi:type IV pilus assembly protein PilB